MQKVQCEECQREHQVSDFGTRLLCVECNSLSKLGELYCGRHLPKDKCKCGLKKLAA